MLGTETRARGAHPGLLAVLPQPSHVPMLRRDQRTRMGTPGFRARGLSCDSPASHKLH